MNTNQSPHSHREEKYISSIVSSLSPQNTQECQAICSFSSALFHQFQIHVMEHTGISGQTAAIPSAHFHQVQTHIVLQQK